MQYQILDDNQAQRPDNSLLRGQLLRWLWRSLIVLILFAATPSFIMYNWGPSEVNEVSPIEAHILVFSLFGIAAIALIALIVLLIWRWRLR
jgi:Zn-dependent protease with chaperone function